jgi:CDP-diacylglycerol--glycerol-3-phosphate 3-phosphatidyltransferase
MRLRDMFNPRELIYPANLLSLSRFALLPPTLYYLHLPERRRTALILLALGMLTDAIDGPIARARDEVSRLGEILDPIADKLVLDGTAIALSRTRGFPWWVTGLLLFRDIGIVLAALVVLRRRAHITTAQTSGKATTVLMTLAALLYIADGERSGRPVLMLALIPFSLSFVQYGKSFVELMRRRGESEPSGNPPTHT